MVNKILIKEIISRKQIANSVEIIRNSFNTVAEELNLSYDNCPTHPSFITFDKLIELQKRGLIFFGFYKNDLQIGFIAIERSSDDIFYIEKLSILPEYRHNGYGLQLVQYAIDFIKSKNGKTISIGIIDEQVILKQWYEKLGFNEIMTKNFNHLPFTVCFMEKRI